MASDPSIVSQAHEWIDRVDAGRGLSNGWRLQVIQKRYRKRDAASQDGSADCGSDSCVGTPMRIRRFVPGCPWALVDQAIRYLVCKAPYEGLIYNGLEIPGTYRPTLTMWQRDEQSSVDEQGLRNGTYTLVQDLIEEGCEDEETVVTGESCSYVETTEYHWDDSAPGELPGCSDGCEGTCQGITYAVRSNRNDDGSFDWQLVKRVAKTVHTPRTMVDCDCTSETYVESWDNLYGDPDSGFRYGGSDGCVGEVDVGTSCSDGTPGLVRQVTISRNDDCTYKAQVVEKVSKTVSDGWTDGTVCTKRETETFENSREKPTFPEPAAGETVNISLKRNDDCTYSGSVTRTTSNEHFDGWTDGTPCRTRETETFDNARERPVLPEPKVGETVQVSMRRNDDCTYSGSVVRSKAPDPYEYVWKDGPECRRRETVVRKDLRDEPEPPEVKPGETLSYQKTRNEDCTWDEQYTVTKPFSGEPLEWEQGSKCRPQHVWSYQNVAEVPPVPEPTGGTTVSASIRRNDDCTFDAQFTVTEPSAEAILPWEDGTKCGPVRKVTSYQNSAIRPETPKPSIGETVRVSMRRNDDCTYDGSVEVVESREMENGWTVSNCLEDVETVVRRNLRSDPSNDGTIPVGETGKEVTSSIRLNDDCTYDAQYSVATPHQKESRVFKWRSGDYEVETVQYRNLPAPILWNDSSSDVTVSCEFSMNRFCLYDGTVRKTRRVAWSSSADEDYVWGPNVGPWVLCGVQVDPSVPQAGRGVRFPTDLVWRCYIEGSRSYKYLNEYLTTLNEDADSKQYQILKVDRMGSYGRHSTCFFITIEYRGNVQFDCYPLSRENADENIWKKGRIWKSAYPTFTPVSGTGLLSKDKQKDMNFKTTGK